MLLFLFQPATQSDGTCSSETTTDTLIADAWPVVCCGRATALITPPCTVQILIVHVQYFMIITRLDIDWPPMINSIQSAFGFISNATSQFAFAPSCLPGGCLTPNAQAAWDTAAALLMPAMATVLSLLMWSLRWA